MGGFGGARRRILAILTLLAYVIANAIFGAALRADALGATPAWPLFGCLLWAVCTTASAWRQLSITDEAEIRESFDTAMGTIRTMKDNVKDLDAVTQTWRSLTSARFNQPYKKLPTFSQTPQDPDRAWDHYQQQKGRGKDKQGHKEG